MIEWRCPKCGESNSMDLLSSSANECTMIAHCDCGCSYEVIHDAVDWEGDEIPDYLKMAENECALCENEYSVWPDPDDDGTGWQDELRRNICPDCWAVMHGEREGT